MTPLPTRDDNNGYSNVPKRAPTPVTLMSGFLGSGKTTLLKHILESSEHGLKIAVIVNDMAELNIDASLIKQTDLAVDEEEKKESMDDGNPNKLIQAERKMIELQNGCICCTLRVDLIRAIAGIRSSGENYDCILIESTGIAEPQQVAEGFMFDADTASIAKDTSLMLWEQCRLDNCVTVIDCHSFLSHISTLKHFSDEFDDGLDRTTEDGLKEGTKNIAHLLVDQVEFANVILLNKTDLSSNDEITKISKIIKTMNPKAKLIESQYAKVDPTEILNTGLFDLEEAKNSPDWLLSAEGNHTGGEIDEYGVGSLVYRARVPFHPGRLVAFMNDIMYFRSAWLDMPIEQRSALSDQKHKIMVERYGMILRAKGFCWLAGEDSTLYSYAQSGRLCELREAMQWYATIPAPYWAQMSEDDVRYALSKFEKPHGDRRQEIVFIGTGLKEYVLRTALDACLLTESELESYQFYSDGGFDNKNII